MKQAMPAIVVVSTPEGWGSGFFISQKGVVVPNAHVDDLNEKFEEVIIWLAVEAGFVVNALFAAGTVRPIGKATGFV